MMYPIQRSVFLSSRRTARDGRDSRERSDAGKEPQTANEGGLRELGRRDRRQRYAMSAESQHEDGQLGSSLRSGATKRQRRYGTGV